MREIFQLCSKSAISLSLLCDKGVCVFTPQRFLDMTFGAGGHTAALLERASDISVYALDRDPTAHRIAQQLAQAYP